MARGLLTESDREWLRGDKDYAHAESERNKKQDIRERVKQTLSDFELLSEELPDGEIRKIFEDLSEESDSHCVDEVSPIIEFLYTGLNMLTTDPESHATFLNSGIVDRKLAFRRTLRSGITRGKENFEQPDIHADTPDTVTIASNTPLYESPGYRAIRSSVNTDQWRKINKGFRGDGIQDHDNVAGFIHAQIEYKIEDQIASRHSAADKDIREYSDYSSSDR